MYLSLRGEHRQGQGDGAPTATDIEEALAAGFGGLLKQDGRALIDAGGAENAVGGGDGDLAACQLHLHGAGLELRLGGLRKVMLLAHAIRCTGRSAPARFPGGQNGVPIPPAAPGPHGPAFLARTVLCPPARPERTGDQTPYPSGATAVEWKAYDF